MYEKERCAWVCIKTSEDKMKKKVTLSVLEFEGF